MTATFRVRNSDQVRRSWRRASLRFAAQVLRKWGHHDIAELLCEIADSIMWDVPPPRTGWDDDAIVMEMPS